MLVLRISLPFEIPILHGSDYVAFVRSSKLKLYLVSLFTLCFFEQKIQAAGLWLISLPASNLNFAPSVPRRAGFSTKRSSTQRSDSSSRSFREINWGTTNLTVFILKFHCTLIL